MKFFKRTILIAVIAIIFIGGMVASASTIHPSKNDNHVNNFVNNMIGIQQQINKAPNQ